jgi:hypothetical protein
VEREIRGEEAQGGGTFVGGRWYRRFNGGAPSEGVGLAPRANHLQQLAKGIVHGEGDLQVKGEQSEGVSHLAGARSFAALGSVPVELIGTQDLRGECNALRWTKRKRQRTDEWKEDRGDIGNTKGFDACADESQSNGCRPWCR